MPEYGGEALMAGYLLAVGVIYHAVDMDLFAHVHCEYEGEPARAEVGAGLDPTDTQIHHDVFICMKDLWKINTQTGCHLSDLCSCSEKKNLL